MKEIFIIKDLFTGLWSQELKNNGKNMYIKYKKYKTASAEGKVGEKFQWQLQLQINK